MGKLIKQKYVCEDCDGEYTIVYDDDVCDGGPTYCPWCAEYITQEENLKKSDFDDELDDE